MPPIFQSSAFLFRTNIVGEQVKIPLLPNNVGKRSGTMTMVTTSILKKCLTDFTSKLFTKDPKTPKRYEDNKKLLSCCL